MRTLNLSTASTQQVRAEIEREALEAARKKGAEHE